MCSRLSFCPRLGLRLRLNLNEARDKQGSDFWVIFRTFARCPEYLPKANGKISRRDSEIFKKVHVYGAGNNEKNTEQNKSKNNNKNKVKAYISYNRLKFWLTFPTTLLSVSLWVMYRYVHFFGCLIKMFFFTYSFIELTINSHAYPLRDGFIHRLITAASRQLWAWVPCGQGWFGSHLLAEINPRV